MELKHVLSGRTKPQGYMIGLNGQFPEKMPYDVPQWTNQMSGDVRSDSIISLLRKFHGTPLWRVDGEDGGNSQVRQTHNSPFLSTPLYSSSTNIRWWFLCVRTFLFHRNMREITAKTFPPSNHPLLPPVLKSEGSLKDKWQRNMYLQPFQRSHCDYLTISFSIPEKGMLSNVHKRDAKS